MSKIKIKIKKKKGINVLSLFDGMSCGQIALNKIGIKYNKYFASEIDKYAIEVTQNNYPQTIQLGDVKSINIKGLPKIDLLMGGSPCQGLSIAGKKLGLSDPRSILFWEFVKIKNELNPKYFLLENVKMNKESQNVISDSLAVQPQEINSNLVSAQNRKRLYWTNIPGIKQPKDKNILLKDIIESGYVDRDKSFCIDANYFKGGNLKQYFEKSRRQLVFEKHGFNKGGFFYKDKFNTLRSCTPYNYAVLDGIEWRKLTPIECERLQTIPDNYTDFVSNAQRYKMLGNGWTVDVICHILKCMDIS